MAFCLTTYFNGLLYPSIISSYARFKKIVIRKAEKNTSSHVIRLHTIYPSQFSF